MTFVQRPCAEFSTGATCPERGVAAGGGLGAAGGAQALAIQHAVARPHVLRFRIRGNAHSAMNESVLGDVSTHNSDFTEPGPAFL